METVSDDTSQSFWLAGDELHEDPEVTAGWTVSENELQQATDHPPGKQQRKEGWVARGPSLESWPQGTSPSEMTCIPAPLMNRGQSQAFSRKRTRQLLEQQEFSQLSARLSPMPAQSATLGRAAVIY